MADKKPILLALDDDPQVLRAVVRDLRTRYRNDYRILSTESAQEALSTLTQLKQQQEVVALFLSDQRMPEMLGVDFLAQAKVLYPEAKRVLLTAYSDIEAAIRAINQVGLDYYLVKPWDPPEENLYPVLDDQLEAWQSQFIPPFIGIRVVGYQHSPKAHQIKDFLSGNLIPYLWLDALTDPAATELMALHGLGADDLPAVVFEDGSVLRSPDLVPIAEKVGLRPHASTNVYDVVIIGAGPAGLAAGVYGGSEGLSTLLIERRAPGGQAGTSSRIENYLGFPSGLSGADLSRRAIAQAQRFGVEFLAPQTVASLRYQAPYKVITLADGTEVNAKAVVLATGVDYRRHPAANIDQFTGAGVYYGAANTEAHACRDKDVYIVGGGNSAGQAALYLAGFAKDVYIVVRTPDLRETMSSYLIDRIDEAANIHLVPLTNLKEVRGNEYLECVVLEDLDGSHERAVPASVLLIFIGAKPYTDWLPAELLRNERGFVLTGADLQRDPAFKQQWRQARPPMFLETSVPGVFAAGDVRAGAMNRVAGAVGEGAMSIKLVHEFLATL